MIIYKLYIVCVNEDGYTFYSQSKERVLEFLKKYDHEGSALWLTITDYGNANWLVDEKMIQQNNEEIYKELETQDLPGISQANKP